MKYSRADIRFAPIPITLCGPRVWMAARIGGVGCGQFPWSACSRPSLLVLWATTWGLAGSRRVGSRPCRGSVVARCRAWTRCTALETGRRGHHLVHQVARGRRRQHPQRHPAAQPLPQGNTDPTGSWHALRHTNRCSPKLWVFRLTRAVCVHNSCWRVVSGAVLVKTGRLRPNWPGVATLLRAAKSWNQPRIWRADRESRRAAPVRLVVCLRPAPPAS